MSDDLKILKGSPIQLIDNILVHPLTLGEISELGEDLYVLCLNGLLMSKNHIPINELSYEERVSHSKLTEYQFFIQLLEVDLNMREIVTNAIRVFLRTDSFFDEATRNFYLINNNNHLPLKEEDFLRLRDVLSKQNFRSDSAENYKPANKKANALLERLNKVKSEIQKKTGNDSLTLADTISIVASNSKNISILNVWELTVNQLYLEYLRLVLWDNYHNDYIHLPHMSEKDRKEMKHWVVGNNKIKL
ncbi:hypothetical protein NSS71_08740 [Niallia sp. FSL W8-0951]|uniref:hypothetical protein n=1 Tax=Niallia sp. FSL W8-0951 TaxID=2954639 RepID=UPI0030F95F9A